ncbi:nucleotidyl transferase AbiEii/AbiGii toxin family protein [Candidatus Marsarchaeota archaeon]|nr:nucleotidyl transferase AbiEii/AbiGii toxin family protein [Candidatus Marsarchaeota archaeon]
MDCKLAEVSLKTERQRELAMLQDRIVEAIFAIDQNLVMHGGTAIWRCYNGNRFSDDIDIYSSDSQVKTLLNKLDWAVSKIGINLKYLKFDERTLIVSDNIATCKLKMMEYPKKIHPIEKEYLRANGTKFIINTLSADEFVIEKISAYQKRRYIMDLYDIYHLATNEVITAKTKSALKKFVLKIDTPIDEKNLRELVYVGVVPNFETIVLFIKRVLK